jgi:hypothetical protein
MNSYQIGFLYLLSYGCLFTFSLWENPPQWRTPRQTEGGIFHRQAAQLCYRLFLFYSWLGITLHRSGVPAWLVNLIPYCLPGFIRRAGAREYMRRREEIYGGRHD